MGVPEATAFLEQVLAHRHNEAVLAVATLALEKLDPDRCPACGYALDRKGA
jgi:hypothetical protein